VSSSKKLGHALLTAIERALADDPFWAAYFRDQLAAPCPEVALHVAIFHEPFLTWVLEGKKRVESRFSQKQIAPFGSVKPGDAVLLKRVSGPLVGICHVNAAWSYRLDPSTWSFIRERFSELLCAEDEEFWIQRKDARFATLISIDAVRRLPDISYPKNDRRGWVIELGRLPQHSLDL
jgi:hypothetical protein